MTILELIDELKRYDNDLQVFFRRCAGDDDLDSMVDFRYSPSDKEVTLEFYS